MAENTRSLAETEHDDTTMKIECKIVEQLEEELTTSFECLMCCKGFQSVEEFQRHQNEHAITQSETLQVHLIQIAQGALTFNFCSFNGIWPLLVNNASSGCRQGYGVMGALREGCA